jgi:hypothetical protein
MRFSRIAHVIAILALVAGCGSSGVRGQGPEDFNQDSGRARVAGRLGGDDGLLIFGTRTNRAEDGAALGVNAYLWRAALDTLSFMPLASADPFGGVIITDWYQPPAAPGERFKATAYILGRQLRADGVRVAVFRQVLERGQWVDGAVSPSTGSDLEDRVLARARELRSQTAAR